MIVRALTTVDVVKDIVLDDNRPVVDSAAKASPIPGSRSGCKHGVRGKLGKGTDCPLVIRKHVHGVGLVLRKIAPPSIDAKGKILPGLFLVRYGSIPAKCAFSVLLLEAAWSLLCAGRWTCCEQRKRGHGGLQEAPAAGRRWSLRCL